MSFTKDTKEDTAHKRHTTSSLSKSPMNHITAKMIAFLSLLPVVYNPQTWQW